MASFPLLSTGAVAQYPLTRGTSFAVEAILFLDGTGQRCVTRGKKLRRWQVALSQLAEAELQQIESFFDGVQGNFGAFTFVDPYTGESVPNCRLSNPSVITQYKAVGTGTASLWIEESND
jgi:hypothetical protein